MAKFVGFGGLTALVLLSSSVSSRAAELGPSIVPTADVVESSAAAGPIFSMLAEGWGGGSFVSGRKGSAIELGAKDSLDTYGGDTRIAAILPSGLYLQGDLIGESTTADKLGNNNFRYARTGGGHAGIRNSQYLLGGFGAYGDTFSEMNSATFWSLGVEGRYIVNDVTLYGQLGYFDSKDSETGENEFIHKGTFARGLAKYALSDTAQLSGELSYAAAREANVNADIFGWGARFDMNFGGSPISAFLAYNGTNYDNQIGKYEDDVVKVGLQLRFGGSNSRDFERNGATLDMPNFGRWVGAGNSID